MWRRGRRQRRLITQEYSIKFLLSQCIVSEENGYFTRFDIIINYLAIENYYGKNDFGWKFHDQYEKTSGFNDPVESKERFVNLIKSFEKDGNLISEHPLKLSDINYRTHMNYPNIKDVWVSCF